MGRNLARPVALAVIRDGDELLLMEGRDDVKGETFYRPLGGTVEFGERAADAVARELMEEIEATVTDTRLLGVIENTFTYQGKAGHEIDFIFAVSVRDVARLRTAIVAYEADGSTITCVWKRLGDLRAGARLYPPGLLALIDADRR